MRYFITPYQASKTGYALIIDDGQNRDIMPLDKSFYEKKSDKTWINLPEKVHHIAKLVNKGLLGDEEVELGTFGRTRSATPKAATPKAGLADLAEKYLSPDELELWKKLNAKIEKGSAIEKARLVKEQAEAAYQKLLAELGA